MTKSISRDPAYSSRPGIRYHRLLAGAIFLALSGCDGDRTPSGVSGGNDPRGRILLPGGKPAVEALIQAVPLPDDSGPGVAVEPAAVYSFRTDGEGYYTLRKVPNGWYGIYSSQQGLAAFRDSVRVENGGPELRPDTLGPTGSWYVTAAVQPFDDVRSVSIGLVGTDLREMAGEDGWVRFSGIAPRRYRAVASTRLPDYLPVVVPVQVESGEIARSADTVKPVFLGLPVAEGVRVDYVATQELGLAMVSWKATAYGAAKGYAVFRDTANAAVPSVTPFATVPLGRTGFQDTLFKGRARTPQAEKRYEYRVAVIGQNGAPGPRYAFGTAVSIPPADVQVTMPFEVAGKPGRRLRSRIPCGFASGSSTGTGAMIPCNGTWRTGAFSAP